MSKHERQVVTKISEIHVVWRMSKKYWKSCILILFQFQLGLRKDLMKQVQRPQSPPLFNGFMLRWVGGT